MAHVISQEQATLIQDIAEGHDVEVRPNYSGRGMYGKSCFGLVGYDSRLHNLLCELMREDVIDEDMKDSLSVGPSKDNMGLSNIWYWIGIEVE